jgi:2-polyprenyl-3-methyl-5-hydroxy-6-metoxy-1,4-benzoquinol methylase
MILCPECRRPYADLNASACLFCDWRMEHDNGLPIMLAARDRHDPTFAQYIDNYDVIARDDLEETIQDPDFLKVQTDQLAALVQPVHGLDVCDVGVGQGGLVNRLEGHGAASVTGVDIATAYLRRLHGGHARLLVANAENLPFRNEFDVLVAADVFEHVLNPGDFLISAHEALRRNGRFVVRVPNQEDLRSYGQLWDSPYRFVHLRSFTRDTLRLMLEQAGFRVERLVPDGFMRERVRPVIQRNRHMYRAFNRFMDHRHPRPAQVCRIDAWVDRAVLIPSTLTAIARREGT